MFYPPPILLICIMWSSHITYNYAQSNQAPPPSYEFWNSEMQAIADSSSKPGLIYFKDDFDTPPEDIFTVHKEAFGLGEDDSMYLYKEKIDELGWGHQRFKQYFNGFQVETGDVSVHFNESDIILTGNYVPNFNGVVESFIIDTNNIISSITGFHSFANNDEINTIFVIDNQNNFQHCMEIIYLDSLGFTYSSFFNKENELIKSIPLDNTCTSINGCTLYNGNQNFNITHISATNQYLLEEQCNSAFISTGYAALGSIAGSTQSSFQQFIPNDFNCIDNPIDCSEYLGSDCLPKLASLHWGLKMSIEFINQYNIDCFHSDCIHRQGYVLGLQNAIMHNSGIAGFGSLYTNLPLASLDVIAHEWGHALTKNYDVGPQLVYTGEPGMINESFSDVLGVMVEFYAEGLYDNEKNGDWLYGEDYSPTWVRNFENPKDVPSTIFPSFIFPQPDTYGKYLDSEYYTSSAHTGSGVLNFWFYLLSNGGSGQNDHNFCYEVIGIEKENAFEILLYAYLNYYYSHTEIKDAREYTILAASVLFGNNSLEVEQVKKAWDAVGVYQIGNETSGVYINANNERIYFNYDLISDLVLPFQTTIFINKDFTIKEDILFDITSGFCNIYVAPNSNIIIEDGAILKANRANFYFGENASIIVKTNGNIDFGPSNVYLGKGSYCDDGGNNFWKGIVVEDLQDGEIQMNATTIENAEIALYFEQQNQTPFFTIDNSNFINNRQSIVARNTTAVPINWGNTPSSITNSNIRLDNQLPSLGYFASIYYLQDLPQIDISGFVNNGFNIDECDFFKNSVLNQTAIQFNGDISLSNSKFNGFEKDLILAPYRNCKISNNEFLGFETGIRVSARNRHASYLLIEDNLFQGGVLGININSTVHLTTEINNNNIFSFTKKGIYALNTDKLLVEDNKFFVPPASNEFVGLYNRDNYGIFLAGSRDYIVENNEFHLSGVANLMTYLQNIRSYGVITDNSGFTGKCSIFDNTFNETNFGYNSGLLLPTSFAFHSQGINDRVLVRCNNFNINNGRMRGMNIVSGTLAKQGVSCDNNTLQAGNEWSNLCEPGPFGATVDNADIYISNTAQPFEYWAHAQNESGLETTIPKCNFLPSGFLKVCDGNEPDPDNPSFFIRVKTSASCDEPYVGLKSLKVLKDSLSQHELLFVKIPEQQSAKNNLITQLSAKQNQLNDPEQQKVLVNEISYLNNEILIVNKNLSRLFEAAEMFEEAKQVLQEDNDVATKMELLQTLLKKGETDEAEALLNSLIGQYQASYFFDSWEIESKFIDNINYEREVASIEKDMVKGERDTLLPNEKIILDGIKVSDLPVASKAEVLLIQSGTDWDEHPIIKIEEELLPDSLELDTFDYALLATPNPSLGQTEISFNLPNGVNEYILEVIDTYQNIGQVKYSHTGQYDETTVTINTSNWTIGTYSVVLNIQGELVSSLHLLVLY